MKFEICTNSLQSALNAQAGGANRVELCENLWEGGTTPSFGHLVLAKKLLHIEALVLVRPRGGDFVYSDVEFDMICQDIIQIKELGLNGIVSGVLNPDGTIDKVRTKILVELSKPLPFVFHRAFDCTPDPVKALEDLIDCGVRRVLTAGQKNSALEGVATLNQLHEQAANRIEILPGGGLNLERLEQLAPLTPIKQFHLTAKMPKDNVWGYQSGVNMNGTEAISEVFRYQSDEKTIRQVRAFLDRL